MILLFVLLALLLSPVAASAAAEPDPVGADDFLELLSADRDAALERIDDHWQDGFVPMVLEVVRLARGLPLRQQLMRLAEKKTAPVASISLCRPFDGLFGRRFTRS